jgi:methylmalonyl-CoA mutase C-terminal domain/subunit
MTEGRGIRVLVSMIGLDSHTTGAEVVATLLRDAGFEVEELMDLVARNGLSDVPVVCGGHIPPRQVERLMAKGVAKIFLPGTPGEAIVEYLAGCRRFS